MTVAALALGYSELAEPCEGADDSSLLAKMAADVATEADWEIVAALSKPAAQPAIAAELSAVDPLRAEALFHAWPPDSPQPPGKWQEPYSGRRGREVENAMDTLRELGLTATRAEAERVASAAREQAERLEREPSPGPAFGNVTRAHVSARVRGSCGTSNLGS